MNKYVIAVIILFFVILIGASVLLIRSSYHEEAKCSIYMQGKSIIIENLEIIWRGNDTIFGTFKGVIHERKIIEEKKK